MFVFVWVVAAQDGGARMKQGMGRAARHEDLTSVLTQNSYKIGSGI